MILSLKTVYMLLMTDDFPIYSESVVSRADRKGLTLLRFWQCQMAEEFRSLPYGRMIWRDDEKRNRYISYLCNRSAALKCYPQYAKELASRLDTAALLSQIGRFEEFLSGRRYRQDVLFRRVQELMRLAEQEDPCVSAEIAGQIHAAAAPALQGEGRRGELFQAGYLLTLLALYAAAGEAMDDAAMAVLRTEAYSLEALWQACSQKQQRSLPAAFLTVHCSLLQDHPLPRDRFFGRETELFDLLDIAAAGRKCIVTGMGGVGKTELLRQLLRRCERENTAGKIALVPYIGSLTESFARAFSDFCRQEPEEALHGILYRLEQAAQGGRTLLLIDNVDKSVKEDPALAQLQALSCGVILTTRQQRLEGFEVYPVGPPTAAASLLIFRDNYGRTLTGQDREVLAELLADEAIRHPATLRLMARAAGSKGWSAAELRRQLQKNGVSLAWQEERRTVSLSQMYRQLYSYMDIPAGYRALAELFTLLPRDHYATAFLQRTFPNVAGEAAWKAFGEDAAGQRPAADAQYPAPACCTDPLEQGLAALAAGGWLEYDGSGYSMHPLIAQCLRRRTLTEKRLETVLGPVRDRLLQEDVISREANWSEENYRICHIFLSVCRLLSGKVSRELVQAVLTALIVLMPTRQDTTAYQIWLSQLLERCPEKDDRTMVFYCMVLGHLGYSDALQCEAIYRGQKERPTVPKPLFLAFCTSAGIDLAFQRKFTLAQQLLSEGLDEAAAPFLKATAYYYLAMLCEYQGDWEKKQQWAQRGAEYVTAHPECGQHVCFLILVTRCEIHMQYGQKQAAEPLLKKIQGLLREDSPVLLMKGPYENLAGAYELTFGSPEQALAHYSRCLEIALQYNGKNAGYYMALGQVAIVLQRLERYEEAITAYSELLEYARAQEDIFMLQRFHNNLAVLYLEMKKPEQALRYLPTALEKGQVLGGIALAEALRNTARAHRLLGDTKQEHRYWQQAAPLLQEVYGPEHPRAREAAERLAELENA